MLFPHRFPLRLPWLCTLLALVAIDGGGTEPPRANAVVAADGSGDFTSLQEAINAAPHGADAGVSRWVIAVRAGTYRERIYVQRERGRMLIRGDGAADTIIEYDLHANLSGPDDKAIGTFRTPTVQIDGDDMIWEDITLSNTAGPVGQALALRADGDRLIFRRCRFLGWQDTVLLNRGRQYFEDCYIEGHVDFIFGAATAWFQDCRIHVKRNGYITAASTPQEQPHGFILADCTITAEPGIDFYLGRPWRDHAATIFLRCVLPAELNAAGWHNWRKTHAEQTARYAEGQNTGPGARTEGRVGWVRQLAPADVSALQPDSVLGAADGWRPAHRK